MPSPSKESAPIVQPPRWLRALIRACLPHEDKHSLPQELDALYASRVLQQGKVRANFWYARQTFSFIARLAPLNIVAAIGPLDSLPGDVRMAMRFLVRRPGYVCAFVLTLGIGAGVLCTAYTAANWVLLRPVPGVRDADQLITLRLGSREAPPFVSFEVSNPDLVTLRERMPALSGLAATMPVDVDVRAGDGLPVRLAGELVTSNYFAVLRTRLIAGRTFVAADEASARGDNVVVVSQAMARRSSRDVAAVVGTNVRINGTLFQIIGVTEPEFRGGEIPGRAELWFPLSALTVLDPSANAGAASNRGIGLWRRMIGRLATPLSNEAVVTAANGVMNEVRTEYKGTMHSYLANHFTFQAFNGVGLNPSVRDTVQRTLSLVALAGGFLMLLAIANLANLTMTQATAREGAMAVRVALGASRARIARGILLEALLLGMLGGVVALVLSAFWSQWFEGATLAERGGSLTGMRMEPRVVVATFSIALLAAVIATGRQAFAGRSSSFQRLLRQASPRATASSSMRLTLVAVQVALSCMLVVAAGLLGRTVNNLRHIELGFVPDRLLTFAVDPHLHGYEGVKLEQLGVQLEQQLVKERSVSNAGFISPSPLASGFITGALYSSSAPEVKPVIGAGFFVSPGFLRTLGVTVLAGDRHWAGDSATVVISEGALHQLFPGMNAASAVGREVPTRPGGKRPLRIAAVVSDVQLSDITSEPVPTYFRPLRERHAGMSVSGFVRTTGAPVRQIPAVRRALQAVAPELPVFATESARSVIDKQFAERKIMALAASTLSALGVVLAAIGLYGVLASLVALRQREIGIRVALGATPGHVRLRVLKDGLRPTCAGLVVGMISAAFMSSVLKSQLYGLSAHDVRTYAAGAVGLLVVSAVTCLVPAWRATRVAPAVVMRSE